MRVTSSAAPCGGPATAPATAAQLVVAQLAREGVRLLFTLTGGHIAPIHDACLDAGLRVVDVRHEDAGEILSFGRQVAEPDAPGRFLDPGASGCLGVGLPFANAAALARPGAPVVCLTGDGALGLN